LFQFYILVQSEQSFSYTANILITNIFGAGGLQWQYKTRELLVHTRYPATKSYEGDVVPKSTLQLNWTTNVFEKGSQFAFNIEFNSYLSNVNQNKVYTFYYTLTDNYTNIVDFFQKH